jgi:hypothetical protein
VELFGILEATTEFFVPTCSGVLNFRATAAFILLTDSFRVISSVSWLIAFEKSDGDAVCSDQRATN